MATGNELVTFDMTKAMYEKLEGEIDDLDEKSGKLLIPAGNKTYLAQLQVVNNKPVLAYVEEE